MPLIFKLFENFLVKYPFISQSVNTGVLMGIGDIIAQTVVEKNSIKKINSVRVGQFTLIGLFFVGPPVRLWYGLMDKYIGSKGKTVALKKVAADQLLFAPTFLALLMAVATLVQGSSIEEMKTKVRNDYFDVLKNNYKVWPAVQMGNFYLVPLRYQVIYTQFFAVFWNTYISWKLNKDT